MTKILTTELREGRGSAGEDSAGRGPRIKAPSPQPSPKGRGSKHWESYGCRIFASAHTAEECSHGGFGGEHGRGNRCAAGDHHDLPGARIGGDGGRAVL